MTPTTGASVAQPATEAQGALGTGFQRSPAPRSSPLRSLANQSLTITGCLTLDRSHPEVDLLQRPGTAGGRLQVTGEALFATTAVGEDQFDRLKALGEPLIRGAATETSRESSSRNTGSRPSRNRASTRLYATRPRSRRAASGAMAVAWAFRGHVVAPAALRPLPGTGACRAVASRPTPWERRR